MPFYSDEYYYADVDTMVGDRLLHINLTTIHVYIIIALSVLLFTMWMCSSMPIHLLRGCRVVLEFIPLILVGALFCALFCLGIHSTYETAHVHIMCGGFEDKDCMSREVNRFTDIAWKVYKKQPLE